MKRIIVHGRVQGVFFRDHTAKVAKQLGMRGWVKNREDGKVEIVAKGQNMDEFIRLVKKGSACSKVQKVVISEETGQVNEGFEIRT